MPVYEFKCQKCGKIVEQVCKMGDTVKPIHCNQEMVRVYNNSSIVIPKSFRSIPKPGIERG